MPNPEDRTTARVDVVVIGGGAAGLAAATALARFRRSVLVVDAGMPRNAPADGVHNILGREGIPPRDLLAAGRREVQGYGAEVRDAAVVGAHRDGDGFLVEIDDGSAVHARRVIVASGVVDVLPDVPGLTERWGRDVAHCPFCHGWEARGTRIGILASSPMAAHAASMWRELTDDLVVFANASFSPDEAQSRQLQARGIRMVDGVVASLAVDDDRLTGVRLADGAIEPVDTLVVQSRVEVRAGFLAGLGLEPEEVRMGDLPIGTRIPVGPGGATTVAGVWAAGNVTDPSAQVMGSAAAGSAAGAAVLMSLIADDTTAAIERMPAPAA